VENRPSPHAHPAPRNTILSRIQPRYG
jgi:hypothetical protein